MEKKYEIYYTTIVDYIRWTCPKCECLNASGPDYSTCCDYCGYDIEDDFCTPQVAESTIIATYIEKKNKNKKNKKVLTNN